MPMSTITVAGISPTLKVLGATQQFNYDQDLSVFQITNSFIPTVLIPSTFYSEFRNNLFSGFRWIHLTNNTDTYGSLTLQSFVNAQTTGTNILIFGQDGSITLDAPVVISNDLNLNNNNIINLADPISNQDAATKYYVDNAGGSVTLSGAVTGSGTINSTIVTTLTPITTSQITNFNTSVTAFRLDQFAVPITSINLNSQKIINLATPTLATDAANKGYIDGKTWTTSQITDYITATNALIATATISPSQLTGYSSSTATYLRGDGTWSNFNTAATALRLDQFAIPTASISLNSQKIINLLNPTLAQDAATKNYVDNRSFGFIYMSGNATGTTVLATIFTKIAGTTTSAFLNNFTMPIDNQLVYVGTDTIDTLVSVNVSASHDVLTGSTLGINIYKNGIQILPANYAYQLTQNALISLTISAYVQFATNDYVEIFANSTNAAIILVTDMSLSVTV